MNFTWLAVRRRLVFTFSPKHINPHPHSQIAYTKAADKLYSRDTRARNHTRAAYSFRRNKNAGPRSYNGKSFDSENFYGSCKFNNFNLYQNLNTRRSTEPHERCGLHVVVVSLILRSFSQKRCWLDSLNTIYPLAGFYSRMASTIEYKLRVDVRL